MNEHVNHRKRLRERFLTQGLDGFEDHQVLELLLFYAIPRVDTNDTAHRLLNKFGSLRGVLDATHEELVSVEGVGEGAATFLKLLMSFDRRLQLSDYPAKERFNTLDKIGNYLVSFYMDEKIEKAYLFCFNNKMEILDYFKLAEGTSSTAKIAPRSVIEKALLTQASAIIIAHNHPDGLRIASDADIDFTNQLTYLSRVLNIAFLEHIIVAEGTYFPMLHNGRKNHGSECVFKFN